MKLVHIACVAGLALAGLPLGAQGIAFIAGPGTTGATMNGEPLLPGTAILPGEAITTGPGGSVVLAPTQGQGLVELGGNASATVTTSGQASLQVSQGNAVVNGAMTVQTAQATFQPTGQNSQYVVNASSTQSTMAVVTGNVNTDTSTTNGSTPNTPSKTVSAGAAVQVTDNGTIANTAFNTVQAPSTNLTNTPAASTSH